MELAEKYQQLVRYLADFQGVLVAFSAGIDSTLVLKGALDSGTRVLAVTADSELRPASEREFAVKLAKKLQAPHLVVETQELAEEEMVSNPRNRCYICKSHLCLKLRELAKEYDLEQVVEGSNLDDQHEFRPGRQALLEHGVVSPLAKVGLTKTEIRLLGKELALPNWDKPSNPCLATRFPYGTRLTPTDLKRVEMGEELLQEKGFSQLRLRYHGEVARIEVPKAEFGSIFGKAQEIVAGLKSLGFKYVALDLEGLRSGSFD